MQHSFQESCILPELIQAYRRHKCKETGGGGMLRLTVSPEEYLMINDNIKIIFLGGSKNNMRIMVDAPRDVHIVRSAALENSIPSPEERAKLPKYHAVPDAPEKYRSRKAKR